MRVWLPDRPGALGAVASRIGAVRGDVVGIDILERGAGRAIDELVVQLPDASLVSLLVSEIDQVDGVDVEDVRAAPERMYDARLDALETAALLVAATSPAGLLSVMVSHAGTDFGSEWVAAVDLDGRVLLASQGSRRPPPGWPRSWPAAARRPRWRRASAGPTTWPGPPWPTPPSPSSSAAGDAPSGPGSGASWAPWPASSTPA